MCTRLWKKSSCNREAQPSESSATMTSSLARDGAAVFTSAFCGLRICTDGMRCSLRINEVVACVWYLVSSATFERQPGV